MLHGTTRRPPSSWRRRLTARPHSMRRARPGSHSGRARWQRMLSGRQARRETRDLRKAGFQMAVPMAAAGEDREAVSALESLRQAFPGGAYGEDAQRLLASLLQRLGETAGAVLQWDAFVSDYPDSSSLPEALYKPGRLPPAARPRRTALDDFQRVIRDFPSTGWKGECSYATGYAYAMRGEYPRALQYFQAAGQDPLVGAAGARSRLAVGICLYDMGSFDRAAR